ncbi:hypothetical protein FGIG_07831 [Fasciola gigantica]|uniref:Uncharacterized protein n=1 Tax=Fasciola gigantica TaxID=46835 RepID=A0A504YW54_FASGI|nr:hypothetical protein FGIG_07831 [Fasciola gigantica]
MSTSSEQLKERVRLLQEELQLKRRLLKKAELSKIRHSDVSKDSPLLSTFAERTLSAEKSAGNRSSLMWPNLLFTAENFGSGSLINKDITSLRPGADILQEIRSCSHISNVLLLRSTVTAFHVVCMLSHEHHLKLFILPEGDQNFRLVWDKVLNPSRVELLILVSSGRHTSSNFLVNLLLLEAFQFSGISTSIFSLFTLTGIVGDEDFTVSCKDTLVIPFSTVVSKSFVEFKAAPACCDIYKGTEHSVTWFIVYLPSCMQYFILTLSHSAGIDQAFKLVASTNSNQLSTDLNPSWYPVVRLVGECKPPHCFFAVHSCPDSKQFIGNCCNSLTNLELQCIPFKIPLTEELFRVDESFVASSIISFPVDSTRTLLSVVISPSRARTLTPSHVLFTLILCADHILCTPLRLCDLNLPIESPVASFTLLGELYARSSHQYLLHIAPTVLAGRAYMNMFAWSLAELLTSSNSTTPLQLSFQMPIDTPIFPSLKTTKLSNSFAKLNEIGFLYDAQLRTVHVLSQFVA